MNEQIWHNAAFRWTRHVGHLTVGGLNRYYLMDIPVDTRTPAPMPVIFGFHGRDSTPLGFAAATKLTRVASNNGIITVYPAAYEGTWNVREWRRPALRTGIDDVLFVRSLLDNLSDAWNIDRDRVFATGWSEGGTFVFRVACEMSEQIAAVAVVQSGLRGGYSPVRPVPVLMFHGTADTFHPYYGGEGTEPIVRGLIQVGVPETVQRWLRFNGCTGPPETTYHNGAAQAITYANPHNGATVTLCTIEGMGHQWPGHTIPSMIPGIPPWLRRLGPGTDDVDATAMIVSFFLKHSISSSPQRVVPGAARSAGGPAVSSRWPA
jgi:polyhydroxybutyrate depolymerase